MYEPQHQKKKMKLCLILWIFKNIFKFTLKSAIQDSTSLGSVFSVSQRVHLIDKNIYFF